MYLYYQEGKYPLKGFPASRTKAKSDMLCGKQTFNLTRLFKSILGNIVNFRTSRF